MRESRSGGGTALLLALAAGGLAYWLMNRGTAQASPGLTQGNVGGAQPHETGPGGTVSGGGAGTGAPPNSGSGRSSGSTGGSLATGLSRLPNAAGQAAPSPALVQRLLSDQNARLIYAFQALGFNTQLGQDAPDGIMGPKTRELMTIVGRELNRPVDSITQDVNAALSRLAYYRANKPSPVPYRLTPTWLPEEAVILVNRLGIGYDRDTSRNMAPIQTYYGPAAA